ncbi:MAG: alcohol dehydrogenase catalytic domain-containing protein [Candidatus Dormibacteria bacterium]
MLAAVYHGRNDVRVQEWPEPPRPPRGWVTVKLTWCGICGTDVDEILHGPVLIPAEPHPVTGRTPPLVMGHEATGIVYAEGDVSGLPVGTRVGLENSVGCGTCELCRSGESQLCERMAAIGLMADGALAELITVPASMCAPLPASIPDQAGALAEPLSIAVRAVRRGGDVRGKSVQVFGGGTIGLMVAQLARLGGARSVVVREPSAARRSMAADMDLEVAPVDADVTAAPIVLECTGTPEGFRMAVENTSKHGVTVLVGIHAHPQLVDLRAMLMEERSLVASLSHSMTHDYLPAIDMLEHGFDFEPFITDRIPLDDVVSRGFDSLISSPEQHLKILVDCQT